MKIALLSSWVILLTYLVTNIVIGSYATDKEAYENKTIHEINDIKYTRSKSILYKSQQILLPVWNFNRYIYPLLIMLCLISSFMAWRKKAHNK